MFWHLSFLLEINSKSTKRILKLIAVLQKQDFEMIFPLLLAGVIFSHDNKDCSFFTVNSKPVYRILTERQLWWRGFNRTVLYFGVIISFTLLATSDEALNDKKRDFKRLRYPKDAY